MRQKKQLLILIGVTLIFLCAVYVIHNVVPVVENIFYDMSFSFVKSETPDSVVIIGVDVKSIDEIGAWPWSRSIIAHLIEQIEACSPRVIALDFLFPKRVDDPGSDSLAAVFSKVKNLVVGMRLDAVTDNPDTKMAMVTTEAYKHRFLMFKNQDDLSINFGYAAGKVSFGDPYLTRHADRAGFLNVSTRRTSQKLRELIHVIRAGKEYYPSFGLAASASFLQLKPNQFILDGNGSILLDTKRLRVIKGTGAVRLNFRGESGTIRTISASDVLSGAVSPDRIKGKLVFVGITDAPSSPSDFFITPVGTQFPGVELWATAACDILNNAWIKSSGFLFTVNIIVLLFIFPGCVLLFPGTKKKFAIIVSTGIVIASIILGLMLLQKTGYLWNSGFHLYAWVLLMVWLATRKSDIIIIEKSSLNLDPKVSDESDVLLPPEEKNFIQSIPSNDTASFVQKQLKPPSADDILMQGVDKTMVEADVAQGTPPPDVSVIEEFRKLAGGRIIKCLGSGGMADVYLIWHPRMEVYRAVKVIKPGQPEQWLDRFETEIRIFANLNHPNIVQCYGVGEWHTLPYLEMEFINGASIEDVVKKCKSLTPVEIMGIGILVCRALNYAHHQVVTVYGETYKGIVHRDLKPANILLSKNGHIKLTDFGIARPGSVSFHTADTGKIIGTLPYLAPEQLKEEGLTPLTDVYALGATLYELVAGHRAFPQPDVPSLLSAISRGEYKPLRSSTFLPKELADVIECAMAIDPGKRYGSAIEMGTNLEKVLNKFIQDKDAFVLGNLVKRAFKTV